MTKLVLCKLEGVIMDLLPTVLNEYNAVSTDDNVKIRDIKGIPFCNYVKNPELFNTCYKTFDVFRKSRPMENAIESISWLINKHDVVIFSDTAKENAQALEAKLDWVQHWMPKYDLEKIIFSHSFARLKGDIIISDKLETTKVDKANAFIINHIYNKDINCPNKFKSLKELYYGLHKGY